MEGLFLTCLNLSIRASYMILAVLLIRLLFSKAGKKYIVWLWIAVGIRLICPFSIPSLPAVLPHTEVIPADIAVSQTPQIASGFQTVDHAVNLVLQENFSPVPTDSVNPLQVVTSIAAYVWIVGIVLMIGYMIVSSVLLKIRIMRTCTPVHGVAESSQFESPFVFGMFHPVICLPPCSEEKKKMILLHERTHIERKDNILKPAWFVILAVYWFNPLVWLSYRLLCRDIEMACDEAVIQKMKRKERSTYAEVLLECASSGQTAVTPVSFGETDVRKRIRNILKYRKPSAVLAVGLLVCALAICAGCFADQENRPQDTETPESGQEEDQDNKEQQPSGKTLSVEELLQNPEPYLNNDVHILGNLPQGAAGQDENGEWILYLNGAEDLNKHIRIVDYTPADGSCLVEAYGKVVNLKNGDLALSMQGYTIIQEHQTGGQPDEPQQPTETVLTVEELLHNPSAYVNVYVYVQGNLPQGPAGQDENGEWILYLNGANDLSQHIRIVDYTPTDGSCPVEAYGTLVYLENGDLALSMDGYTVIGEQAAKFVRTVEAVLQNPSACVNTYVYVQGNLPQGPAGQDENGEWILYLSGVIDLNQHIRIVNYTPADGSRLVEAYGTLVYLENGELALSMDGYTIIR